MLEVRGAGKGFAECQELMLLPRCSCFIFTYLTLVLGSHLARFKAESWLCTQELYLAMLRGPSGMPGDRVTGSQGTLLWLFCFLPHPLTVSPVLSLAESTENFVSCKSRFPFGAKGWILGSPGVWPPYSPKSLSELS